MPLKLHRKYFTCGIYLSGYVKVASVYQTFSVISPGIGNEC